MTSERRGLNFGRHPRVSLKTRVLVVLVVLSLGALLGPGSGAADGGQRLKKISKAPGSCALVKLPDRIVLQARPYAMDRGALYFAANVHSISLRRGGTFVEPLAKEEEVESLYGSFQGKIVAKGLKVAFPLEALSSESEVVVRYYGAGFVGDKQDDGEVWFRFDPKSLR